MRSAHDLLTRAQAQKARVILVGDTKQLSAVEAGNPFKSLQAGGMQTCKLDEARRQKRAELKRAVELVAAGAVGESIDVLDSAGCISQVAEESERIAQVAEDFLSLSADERAETLVLAGTNQNRLALTDEIRRGLQHSGELGADTFSMQSLQRKDLTTVQKRYAGRYEIGDVIVPIRDYKQQQLKRSQHYVVRSIDKEENTLALETPDGNLIQINPKDCERKSVYTTIVEPVAVGDRLKWTKNNRVEETRNGQAFTVEALTAEGRARIVDDEGHSRDVDLSGYQHVDYAWISTTYSAQGKTAERVMALTDRATTNREAFYVATSRAKNELRLYTADIEKLRELADESKANENVSDYLPLFELAQEQSEAGRTAVADYAREVAKAAGDRAGQQARPITKQPSQETANSYTQDFSDVPQQIRKKAKWIKYQNRIVRLEEVLSLDGAAQQVQQRATATEQVTGAAKQLSQNVEQTTQRKLTETYTPTTQPLFEIAYEQSTQTQAPTDYAREAARDAGRCAHDRQRAAARSHQQQHSADSGTERRASGYVAEFRGVPQRAERHARWRRDGRRIVRIGEANPPIDDCAQQIQQRTGAGERVASAVTRLNQQLERTTRRRQAERSDRRVLKQDELRLQADEQSQDAVGAESIEPIALQPPTKDEPLTQQLNDFAQVLGYKAGDRLYVRALLPKNLSDEMAIARRLKFEIEESGQKKLIPNTRRGYLTVGSWEFTHIRKGKEPKVYADGLSQLATLNQEGRGIYFVVNPGGEKDGDIAGANTLFWENDDKSKDEQIAQARTSGLPLGAMVETNKSVHCYSPLTTPIEDLDEWKTLQERLIQKMESDPAIRNSSRLMRLPGFDHVRVEKSDVTEELVFTPVKLRHIDKAAKASQGEIAEKLPEWQADRWTKETKQGSGVRHRKGEAAAQSLAADNPWDIRNFAQYLNGDHISQNGWLQVQCPHHGGEGSSGTSLGINEATGQYVCHSGCDSKSVYKAAWQMAEGKGWRSPQAERKAQVQGTQRGEVKGGDEYWNKYSRNSDDLTGKALDFHVAKNAIADRRSDKDVIELLAKGSERARKLYKEQGSTPAYNYVKSVTKAARRALQQTAQRKQNQQGL